MKRRGLLFAVAALFAIINAGCTTPTIYKKDIQVYKDPSGKVTQIIETESITQPQRAGYPVKFEHLKGIIPDEK